MNKAPFFSILVANFNNGKYLHDLYMSLLEQTYLDWECIIIDDGSNDNSIEIIENWNNCKIKLFVNNENKGVAYTKHKCVLEASGELCGFVDPDDLLTPNALEVMVNKHKENEKASMIYSNFYICDETLDKIEKHNDIIVPKEMHLIIGLYPNHFTCFKKDSYFKTDGINLKLQKAVDRDLVLKLEEVGQVLKIHDYLYYYRINTNSISNNNNALKAEYWAWEARYDACKRRSLRPDDIYEIVMSYIYVNQKNNCQCKESIDYKLGKVLLKPLRYSKHLFFR